jgi:hypothetical protein
LHTTDKADTQRESERERLSAQFDDASEGHKSKDDDDDDEYDDDDDNREHYQ